MIETVVNTLTTNGEASLGILSESHCANACEIIIVLYKKNEITFFRAETVMLENRLLSVAFRRKIALIYFTHRPQKRREVTLVVFDTSSADLTTTAPEARVWVQPMVLVTHYIWVE